VPPTLITVKLSRELVEEIRALAVQRDRSLAAELRMALRAYIKESAT
jgi:predicted transcriptional regulator